MLCTNWVMIHRLLINVEESLYYLFIYFTATTTHYHFYDHGFTNTNSWYFSTSNTTYDIKYRRERVLRGGYRAVL